MNTSKNTKTLISSAIFIVAVASFFLNAVWFQPRFFAVFFFGTRKGFLSKTFSLVLISIFLFAVFYAKIKTPQTDGIKAFAPSINAQIKGRITSLPNKKLKNKTNFQLNVYELKTGKESIFPKNTKTTVNIYDTQRRFEQLQIGDVILLKGKLNLQFKAKNPSQFDYGDYLKSKGIFTTFSTKGDNYQIINDSNVFWSFVRQLNIVRDEIIKKHASFLENPKPQLLGSIVFGDDAVGVPEEVYESFIHAGLLHLLAASGLNVALIFAIWFFILSKLNVNYRVNILSGMGIILVYMLMTGLPPSITRAGIMLELALIGN
jgi:competence protein ComEC